MFWSRYGEEVIYFPNLTQMQFWVPFHCATHGAVLLGIFLKRKYELTVAKEGGLRYWMYIVDLYGNQDFLPDRRRKGIHFKIATMGTCRHKSPWEDSYYLPLPFDLTLGELLQDISTHGKNSHRENIGATSPEANHIRHPIGPRVKNLC